MRYSRNNLFTGMALLSLSGLPVGSMTAAINNAIMQQAEKEIKGVIIDESGLPVIGANVIIKGTSVGTITDFDGQFILNVKQGAVLEISFIGYLTQQIKVGNKSDLKIVLKEDTRTLDEVVVVGYGVQNKKSVVGAIAQTNGDELMKSGGVTSVGEALQGKLPGVTAIYTSGRPGEKNVQYYIRGQSSWNGGGQPLILIDGIEGNMEDVDVNEIENISVLKDASATAVYGVKGANGVILLTTKRGQQDKADISLSANVTFKMVSKLPDQMDSYDAINMANRTIMNEVAFNEGSWNDYVPGPIMDMYRNQTSTWQKEAFPNVDWADYMLRDMATDQRVNFSVRGGAKFVKYFCNVSYLHEGDIFEHFDNRKGYESGFDYHRFNYRSNLDFDVTKTTKLGVNISGSYGIAKSPDGTEEERMYAGIYRLGPSIFMPIYEDGSYGFDLSGDYELRNPVADFCTAGMKTENRLNLVTDFTLDQDLSFITKGLSLKGRFNITQSILSEKKLNDGGNTSQYIRKVYVNDGQDVVIRYPDNYTSDYLFTPNPWTLGNYDLKDKDREKRTNYEISLNYKREFGNHNVSALALFKREQYTYGSMFPVYREDWVGRLTYNYAYRYFIEANGAYNGSEKFGPGYRFEVFPSVALGWMVTEEKFMKNVKWLDKLKLKASYGKVGDDNFDGRWKYITQWGTYDKYVEMNKFSYDNSRFSPYMLYKEASIGNPDLHWETSVKQNYGLELAVLNNQIKFDFDYFTENRTDIMVTGDSRAIPSWFGIAAPDANLGEVNVKGYEFVLSGNKQLGSVFLNARFTYSHVKDVIVFKDDPELKPDYQKAAGHAIGQTYALIQGDMIKSWDDVYMSTALADGQESKRIGYYDVIDFNCDGNVNSTYDNVPWGYPNRPQNTWTFDLGGNYKGFSLSVQFYGQNNITRVYNLSDHVNGQRMYFWDNADVWTPENPDGTNTYTAWNLTKADNNPQKFIYDGSMVRLKMVEASYTFPKKVSAKLGIKNLRLFVNGYNLALWTDLPDDRDFNGDNNYRGGYPTFKRFNVGFNMDF